MKMSIYKLAIVVAFGFTPAMAHAADGDRLNFIMYGETIKLSQQTRKNDAGKNGRCRSASVKGKTRCLSKKRPNVKMKAPGIKK